MDRRIVFDAVRALLGRGFTRAEVARLDRAIDRALAAGGAAAAPAPSPSPPPAPEPPHRLGQLSERFESGGAGPGAVSSGSGDPGGVSYGVWQLSSRAGTAAAFAAAEGARWATDFAGAAPGMPAFTAAWHAVAAREPAAFAAAQHAFIERTHYRPTVAAVLQATALDLDSRCDAVRDATWSCAVQHGGAPRILNGAVAAADQSSARADPGYDRALVEAIYAARTAYVRALATRLGPAQARTLQSIAAHRYPAELAAALAMLEGVAGVA